MCRRNIFILQCIISIVCYCLQLLYDVSWRNLLFHILPLNRSCVVTTLSHRPASFFRLKKLSVSSFMSLKSQTAVGQHTTTAVNKTHTHTHEWQKATVYIHITTALQYNVEVLAVNLSVSIFCLFLLVLLYISALKNIYFLATTCILKCVLEIKVPISVLSI